MMTLWFHRFVVAGIVLILAGFAFGLFFGWSVGHETRLAAYEAYQPVFETVANQGENAKWQAMENRISARSVQHRRAADVHGHSINMGILLIIVGLLLPVLTNVGGRAVAALPALIAAAFVYPFGLSLQFMGFTTAGEAVSALGAVVAIVALGTIYVLFSRTVNSLHE